MKVNTKNIPNEYRGIIKEDMSLQDVKIFGEIVIKQWWLNQKEKWYKWRNKE